MKAVWLAALVLWPALAFAQLNLYVVNGDQETPVTSIYHLPDTSPGDLLDTTFRVRNSSASELSISTLTVFGSSFSMVDPPSLPVTVPSGGSFDFVVRFAPRSGGDFSAGLTVNNATVLLLVSAGKTAILAADNNGTLQELQTGTLIDFGHTLVNTPLSMQFVLTNPNEIAVTVDPFQVTGTYFSFAAPPMQPLVLQPGEQYSFTVTFAPLAAGEKNGTLQVAERAFPIRGTATDITSLETLSLVQTDGSLLELLDGVRVDFGSAYLGDTVTRQFVVKNQTTDTVDVNTLAIAGSAFQLVDAPTAPFQLAAGEEKRFSVVFTAALTGDNVGAMQVGLRTIELRGEGVQARETLSVEENGSLRVLSNGGLVDFGSTYRDTVASRSFVISNQATIPVMVSPVVLNAAQFRLPAPVATPLTLQPGDQVSFTVEFAPTSSGDKTGSLQVGAVTVEVKGTAFEAPVPTPSLSFDKTSYGNGEQGHVSVTLESAAAIPLTGNLFLNFTPADASFTPEPGAMFLSGSSKSIPISFALGATQGTFNGANTIDFQTGTTAGTLQFTFELGGQTQNSSFTLAAAGPTVDSLFSQVSTSQIEIRVNGFDNTRSASQMRFTFYNRQGAAIGSPISADVASKFSVFFAATDAGGLFSVQAIFPVTGDTSVIGGVDVELTNSAGTTRAQRLNF